MKKLPITIVLSLLAHYLSAQCTASEGEGDIITWSEQDTLSWEDFKGNPDFESDFLAMTFVSIDLNLVVENEVLKANTDCRFYKKDSWTRNKKSLYLLKHEQLHFDIAEAYARRLKYIVDSICSNVDISTYELYDTGSIIEAAYDSLQNAYSNCSDVYDTDTNHSKISSQQLLWNKKVRSYLEQGDYSVPLCN